MYEPDYRGLTLYAARRGDLRTFLHVMYAMVHYYTHNGRKPIPYSEMLEIALWTTHDDVRQWLRDHEEKCDEEKYGAEKCKKSSEFPYFDEEYMDLSEDGAN